MTLRNLTPHHVRIATDPPLDLPAETPAPRLHTTTSTTTTLTVRDHHIPVVTIHTATVTNLPPPQPDVLLIVSRAVAAASPHRHDLLIPHDLIRDTAGTVIACHALARLHPQGP